MRVKIGEKEKLVFDEKEGKWKKEKVPNYVRFLRKDSREVWSALHLLRRKERLEIGFKNWEEFRKWLKSVGVNMRC